ncbi:MAG: abortive infection system antitoxin AbiGi family protein [bacterium]
MLSSASLFHFTKTFDALRSIIRERGFRPHYARENLEMFGLPKCLGVPMVSFCDIPLSQTEKHSRIYGCYALGLQKEWGKKKSISPIHYIYPDSICAKVIVEIYNSLPEKNTLHRCGCLKFNPQTALFFYAKPYDGKSLKIENDDKVTFYDEREWRYVPFADDTIGNQLIPSEVQPMLSEDDFCRPESLAEKTNILHKHYKLTFQGNDMKYIIVSKEDEIPQMVDDIYKIPQCSEIDKKKLITRIISMEQIQEDF